MEPDTPSVTESFEDVRSWTKTQKLAGLLLVLSPEAGIQIMQGLEEPDLEAVAAEMTKLTLITQEMQNAILEEFSQLVFDAATAIPCNVQRVQSLLESSVGLYRASEIVGRVAPFRPPVAAMQQIVDLESRDIAAALRHEPLPVIALVVSYLPPEKVSQVLLEFRPEVREQVLERVATLAPASVRAVEGIADELQKKMGANRPRALNRTGGIKAAAQVLNALPRTARDPILVALKERNPELSDQLRQKMFAFEELVRLDPKILQKILQLVDLHTLVLALKTANERLKAKLLSCVSKRAAESIREELEFSGTLKLRDIEAAQTQVMDTVRRLEADGEIDLEELHAP